MSASTAAVAAIPAPSFFERWGIVLRAERCRYQQKGVLGVAVGLLGFLGYTLLLPALFNEIYPAFREACPSYFTTFILATLLVHHTAYIVHCVVLYMITAKKSWEEFRVNPSIWPWDTNTELVSANLKVLVFNFFIITPVVSGTSLLLGILNPRDDQATLPTAYECVTQILFCMLVEDAWNSWFHMSMHSKWLYRNVHKTHHEYTMTIGISAEHAHIVEYLWVNIGAVMIGPLILQDRMHLFVLLAWIAYRIGDTVDQHGGYEFPFAPWTVLPLSTSAAYHDFHHSHNVGNYGSLFAFWDVVWGTNPYYYEHLEKQYGRHTK